MAQQRPPAQMAAALAALESDHFGLAPTAQGTDSTEGATIGDFWLVSDRRVNLGVQLAVTTGRPLLVQGLPGTGKSTLAQAIALTLGWNFLEVAMTSRTVAADLLWTTDHVRRLRDAQLGAATSHLVDEPSNYMTPGHIWSAFDPVSASLLGSLDGTPRSIPGIDDPTLPTVLLIDEVDKADPEVPDSLLVPLGTLGFRNHADELIEADETRIPLVVITSNDERDLSAAFLRRCIKLTLMPPDAAVMARIAIGHLGEDATEFVQACRAHLLDASLPVTVSTAAFIDACRGATNLGLGHDDPRWRDVVALITGDDGATA